MTMTVSRSQAQHIIQRLGETGQPPERGALAVNVGTTDHLEILRTEYLARLREGRNSSFKLVQAPFGGGKTHFLHCLREIAWTEGFVTAMVGVSPKECPFDDAVKIYQAVARQLEYPPEGPDEEPRPGINTVLRTIAEERIDQHGRAAVRQWVRDELGDAAVESMAVTRATRLFMEAVIDDDLDRQDQIAAYLRGDRIERSELRDLQLRESLDQASAFRFLRSVIQVLRALGVPGVVLLFDEMDRNMSLGVKRRRAIGDNLRQMIDYCGQSTLPALLWCYAVPPEFMTNVVPEYPALEQRLKGPTRFATTSPLQPIIDLDRIPVEPTPLFSQIGGKLLDLYEHGFEHRFDPEIQKGNIRRLAAELGENQLESGTRRTFVKAAVALLDRQRLEGERPLDDQALSDLTNQAGRDALEPMDGEEDFI